MLVYKALPVQRFGCSYVQSVCNNECPIYEQGKHTRLEVMLVLLSECSFRLSFWNVDWRDVSNDTSSLPPCVQVHNKLLDSTVPLEKLRLLHSISTMSCACFAR